MNWAGVDIFNFFNKFYFYLLFYILGSTFQVPLDSLVEASEELVRALMLREKYMAISMQNFPQLTSKFLHCVDEAKTFSAKFTYCVSGKKSIEGMALSLSLYCP